MNSDFVKILALAALIALPASGWACDEPGERPEIPDPETAATAQMVKANNDIQQYIVAMETYLGCAKMRRSEQREKLSELEDYAEEFNQAVRTFRARNQ